MANYYVSTTGSDSNNGTSPSTPWLTIGKAIGSTGAINPASPAENHTLYIAPGRYAEQLTAGPTPSSTATITVQGDPTGAIFGVSPGYVIWSGFASGDDASPTGVPFSLNQKDWYIFNDIVFMGDDNSANPSCITTASGSAAAMSVNITFRRCIFHSQNNGRPLSINVNGANALNWTIDKCVFMGRCNGAIHIIHALANMTSDIDLNVQVTNCLFCGCASGIHVQSSGAVGSPAGRPGGIDAMSCTFAFGANGFNVNTSVYGSAIPCTVTNSLFLSLDTYGIRANGTDGTANTSGAVTESYNRIIDCATSLSNVTQGTGTVVAGIHGIDAQASFVQGIADRLFFAPGISGIINGDGTSTGQPTEDILGDSRTGTTTIGAFLDTDVAPSGGGSTAANPLVGYVR